MNILCNLNLTEMERGKVNMRKVIIGAILALMSTGLIAQPGPGNGRYNHGDMQGKQIHQRIPNLTPEQEKKIAELRTAHMQEMNNFRNDLMIKQAELNKLQTADNPDINKIDAKIDEIGKMKTDMAKKRAAHRQEVRAILTPEQRVVFDAHSGHQGFGKGMHNRCPANGF